MQIKEAPTRPTSSSVESRTTGALVVGGDHPGLGVARSLGRRGIPVYVIDDQPSLTSYSKYVTKVIRVKDLKDARATVDAVLDAGRKHDLKGWVLYPTRDETVTAFAHHRDELAKFFRVTTPGWETVRWAGNKKFTDELAVKLGIPSPKTHNPQSEEELEPLYSQLPLAVKPAVKENFFYATGAKAWRADTPEQLRDLFATARKFLPPEEVLLQEIIPGGGLTQFSYCAFYSGGKPHSTLTARRIRQHPHEFGRAATYVESVDAPEIEELAERFLKAIDFYGLVELEFKQDPRDGQYKLLDVNPRTWGFQSLGVVAGVDFSYLLYADQLGLPIEKSRARPRVGWMRLLSDIPTSLAGLLAGRISIRSYLESARNTGTESVFCKDDPLPFLAEVALLPYILFKKKLIGAS